MRPSVEGICVKIYSQSCDSVKKLQEKGWGILKESNILRELRREGGQGGRESSDILSQPQVFLLFPANSYSVTQGQPVCVCVVEKTACIRKRVSCSESRMFYSCVQSPVTVEVNTLASRCAKLIGKGDLNVLASSSCRELLGSAGTQGRPVAT